MRAFQSASDSAGCTFAGTAFRAAWARSVLGGWLDIKENARIVLPSSLDIRSKKSANPRDEICAPLRISNAIESESRSASRD